MVRWDQGDDVMKGRHQPGDGICAWWNQSTGETTCNPSEAALWERAGDGVEGLVSHSAYERLELSPARGDLARHLVDAIGKAADRQLVVAFRRDRVRTEDTTRCLNPSAPDDGGKALCHAFLSVVDWSGHCPSEWSSMTGAADDIDLPLVECWPLFLKNSAVLS